MASTLSLVTLILAWRGVMSVEVGTLSNASINKAIGENATVVWNVTGIETSLTVPLIMQLGKGELKRENFIFEFNVYAPDCISLAKDSDSSVHKELASRSTANYTCTGKSSGKETARVSFTINNLTLDDEGSYFLSAKDKFLATNISVNYGPEKCGGGLKSEYIVSEGDQLNITMGFCGKPQPTVRCKFDSQTYNSVIATEINQYNYTYAFVIPTNLKSCERKELICTATVDGKLVTRESTVLGNFSSNLESFIESIKCLQHYDSNSKVSWQKAVVNGNCNVTYRLSFMNGTDVDNSTAFENNNCISCTVMESIISKTVRINTSVYGNLSGSYKLLDSRISDKTNCSHVSTTATTTTTKKPQEDDDDVEGLPIIAIIGGVGGALVVILIIVILVVCCMKKKTVCLVCCMEGKNKRKATAVQLQEVAGDNNAPQDFEGMYAQVDGSNRNQQTNNVSDLYTQVDKKNKSKNQPTNCVSDMYAEVDKKNKAKKEPPSEYAQVNKKNEPKPQAAAAPDNDYSQLATPQGATAMSPQDLSCMYAPVNKNKDRSKEFTIYSELGPGGGRVGPKPTVQPSHYAEAKDFAPQYSTPSRPPKGSYKASRNHTDKMGHDNDGMGDDHEEMI